MFRIIYVHAAITHHFMTLIRLRKTPQQGVHWFIVFQYFEGFLTLLNTGRQLYSPRLMIDNFQPLTER